MKILYLGASDGTALDRAQAYRRLGHAVTHLDPRRLLPQSPWIDRITWQTGGQTWSPWFCRALQRELAGQRFDVCHVDGGEYFTPAAVQILRGQCTGVVNFNHDDPFGPRDGRRFAAYRSAVPHYDLLVVVRPVNVDEARALGARQVLLVRRCADEVQHVPVALTDADRAAWASKVTFVGTWMPERGPFLRDLLRLGVPLTIRGSHWQKAPQWSELQAAYRSGAVVGADYAKAIQCARINLGLLSKGNRDDHTTRSVEVPALGSLLCAERTSDHLAMYEDGKEAIFWSDAAECAHLCHALLADESRRLAVAQAGQRRVHANGDFNERMLDRVLATLLAKTP